MEYDNLISKIEGFVNFFIGSVTTYKVYGAGHKLTEDVIQDMSNILMDVLSNRDDVTLGVVGNDIVFERWPLARASGRLQEFIKYLNTIKVQKITFMNGIRKNELYELVKALSLRPELVEKQGGFDKVFDHAANMHIRTGRIGIRTSLSDEERESLDKQSQEFEQNYNNMSKELSDSIKESNIVDSKEVDHFVKGVVGSLLKNKKMVLFLTTTKVHDEYTFMHNINVTIFTLLQAESLGLSDNDLNQIGVGAMLHDIGKLDIDPEIIRKKEKLTDEERKQIFYHPIAGAKRLLDTHDIGILPAIVAYEHQMKYDMTGYPKKMYGVKANMISMMIAIADCYEAMRSNRPYREPMSPEKVYEEMMSLSGAYLHPDLLENFFRIIGVYPVGTLVEIDNGKIAVVTKPNHSFFDRPTVEVYYEKSGTKIEKPFELDLSEKDSAGNFKFSIVGSVVPTEQLKVPERL